jgi:hypothetical protein
LLILGIGLPTLLMVGALVWFFVIPSPVPGMRWQVLQTLQIAHALWPPFLVMWFYSAGRRQSKILIENTLSSTEILQCRCGSEMTRRFAEPSPHDRHAQGCWIGDVTTGTGAAFF